jgi:type IV pilus assembly protein PilV
MIHSKAQGFSLVEVMVAVLVISVGLLGVAKIQALALSSTGSARMRSQVALASASLAATMHANRAYWANVSADSATLIAVTNGTIWASDSGLQTPPTGGCTAASPCTVAAQLAAQDLHDWTASLRTILPANTNPVALVSCWIASGNPVSCKIDVVWTENLVSTPYSTNTLASAQQAIQAAQRVEGTSYTLYTQP